MVPPVPHELSDHIIDFLHDDPRALSACGLTCRAWLAPARYHRFADITVCGKLGRFLELLNTSPGFAPFVKTLRWESLARARFKQHIDSEELLSIFVQLPSLRELSLAKFMLDSSLVSILCNNLSFASLSRLRLDRCLVDSVGDLVKLVRTPSLEHLDIDELFCSAQDEFDTSISPPSVTSLALSGLYRPLMIAMAKWLLSGGNHTTVRKLRVYIMSREEAKQVANILGTQSEALQQLEVVIDPESNLEVVLRESGLSLACFPHLRRGRLTFKLCEMFVEGTPSLPWIDSMVAQMCGTCLEELVLCIQADDMEDLRALDSECGVRAVSPVRFEDLRLLDWAAISRTLEGSALKSLVVEGRGDASILYAHIAAQWPLVSGLVKCRKAKVEL